MQMHGGHSDSSRGRLALITGVPIDALEQLRALRAPGLDGAHGLIFRTAADAGTPVELRFRRAPRQIDRLAHQMVAADARRWLLIHWGHPAAVLWTVSRVRAMEGATILTGGLDASTRSGRQFSLDTIGYLTLISHKHRWSDPQRRR